MNNGLPSWLVSKYSRLLVNFGFMPFSVKEASSVLKERTSSSVILFRLRERGWARKYYEKNRLVPANVALLGGKWVEKIHDIDRLPIIEIAVDRILCSLGFDLISLVIFGSVARNKTKKESDIDLLVVADTLPEDYSRRVKLMNSIIFSKQIESWQKMLWEEKHEFPLFDIIPLLPLEANTTHPFYLDMAEDAVIVYDRNNFMERKLASLKKEFERLNVRRVNFEEGHFWIMDKGAVIN
jgi:hypothetical protein